MTSPTPDPRPLANAGGLAATPRTPSGDAYGQLNDLMVVIETLCPTLPPRAVETHSGPFLL